MRDAHSFDEFYRETSARLLRYAYAMVGDPADAQDVVQEAYTKAWRNWRTVAGHPAPEAWVRLVVARLATDRWRRMTTWRSVLARSAAAPTIGPPSENTVLLTAALRKLPARHRHAVALHYLFDMSVEDIARETGVAAGTVKSWLSRGRSALATLLSEAPNQQVLEVTDVE